MFNFPTPFLCFERQKRKAASTILSLWYDSAVARPIDLPIVRQTLYQLSLSSCDYTFFMNLLCLEPFHASTLLNRAMVSALLMAYWILFQAPNIWNSISQAIRNEETIAQVKRVKISPFELKDTTVALICTNPWKTSNKILLIVVNLLFFSGMVA